MLTQDDQDLVLHIAGMYLEDLELFGGNTMETLSYTMHVNSDVFRYKDQLFLLETIFTLRHLLLEQTKEIVKERELQDENLWESKLKLNYMEFNLPNRHYQKEIEQLLVKEVLSRA